MQIFCYQLTWATKDDFFLKQSLQRLKKGDFLIDIIPCIYISLAEFHGWKMFYF